MYHVSVLASPAAAVMSAAVVENGHSPAQSRRPSVLSFPTAPSVMTMNGHFAAVGDSPTKEQYEHGIQVIDGDKEFRYGP